MKKLILFLTILLPLSSISQITRFYLNSNTTAYQTIIAFSDSTTDDIDMCCDAVDLPQAPIWTNIGTQRYVINSFADLTDDKWIPLGIRCPSETFEIGIDLIIGDTIQCMIWDSLTNQLYELPHVFNTPTNGNTRFKLFFEYPLSVNIQDLCDSTQVIINDDQSIGDLTLLYNGTITDINSDTIYIKSNGIYTLTLQGDTIIESETFIIDNVNNNHISQLIVPLTQVPINDAIIVPILDLNYTPLQIIWDFGDGNTLYNDINPVHQYVQPGVYTLSVIVISPTGCARYFTEFISVYTFNGLIPLVSPKRSKKSNKYDLSGRLIGVN